MVNLEHIRLLETRITRAIDYVKKVNDENSLLRGKLDSYQKRIDELEFLVEQFKEDQGRIEDGILSALDRLNQFEDAIEQSLAQGKNDREGAAAPVKPAKNAAPKSAPELPKNPAPDNKETVPAQGSLPKESGPEEENVSVENAEDENRPDSGELDIF